MTICIAAKCSLSSGNQGIVYATDRQITLADLYIGYDGPTKARMLSFQWRVMFAGDFATAEEIIDVARAALEVDNESRSVEKIKQVALEAYCSVRDAKIDGRILRPIGFTRARFESEGYANLPTTEIERLNQEIAQYDLGVTLLVIGFDKNNARIFTIRNPGEILEDGTKSSAAIGSGEWLTKGSLLALGANPSLEQAVYRVCEAKFLAEYDTSVGSTTVLSVLRPFGLSRTIDNGIVDAAKSAWRSDVLATPPKAIVDILLAPYNLAEIKFQAFSQLLDEKEKQGARRPSKRKR